MVVDRGGRFLFLTTINGNTEWVDGGEKRGREKVGPAFRDALTEKANVSSICRRRCTAPRVPSRSRNHQSIELDDPFGWEENVFQKQVFPVTASLTEEDCAVQPPCLDGSGMQRKISAPNTNGSVSMVRHTLFGIYKKERALHRPIRSSSATNMGLLHWEPKFFQTWTTLRLRPT